jgi:hypothetical membrane protein
VLGWLAVMGPIALTIAWIVSAVLQDGYSPRQDSISELAALDARHAWIMITGFLLLGVGTGLVLLVLLFSGVAGNWGGVVQRVFVTVLLLWIAILGARLIRLSRTRPRELAL